MSLIHWDKSVLSFHLKEVLEDHQRGDRTALVGLGAIFVGTVVLPATVKLGKPLLKSIIKSGLSLSQKTKSQPSYIYAYIAKSQPQNLSGVKTLPSNNRQKTKLLKGKINY
jgi:hypothetical protein